MKNLLRLFLVLCAVSFLAPTAPVHAGLVNGGFESHHFGKLTAVDLDKSTVSILNEANDEEQTFPLAQETTIISEGKQITLKGLTVGWRVRVDTWTHMRSPESMKVLAITVLSHKKHKK